MSQYDQIAEQYKRTTETEISRLYIEDPNILRVISNIKDQNVLGVGCGDGYLERLLKRVGADRVVGTDQADAMLEIGLRAEKEEPLGIEYYRHDLTNLPVIGQFDLVTAKYVLNYADDRVQLQKMCQSIYKNLRPGGRLVALVPDYGDDGDHLLEDPKYGFTASAVSSPLNEGDRLKVTLYANGQPGVEFVVGFWRPSSYIQALEAAGFRQVTWHKPTPSPKGIARFGEEFWADWMAHPYSAILEAFK